MIIKPVFTEKSMNDAKKNKYTFEVEKNMTKTAVKSLVEGMFKTKVLSVSTANLKGGIKTTVRGVKKTLKAVKKVIVETKDKLDLFEEKK